MLLQVLGNIGRGTLAQSGKIQVGNEVLMDELAQQRLHEALVGKEPFIHRIIILHAKRLIHVRAVGKGDGEGAVRVAVASDAGGHGVSRLLVGEGEVGE